MLCVNLFEKRNIKRNIGETEKVKSANFVYQLIQENFSRKYLREMKIENREYNEKNSTENKPPIPL